MRQCVTQQYECTHIFWNSNRSDLVQLDQAICQVCTVCQPAEWYEHPAIYKKKNQILMEKFNWTKHFEYLDVNMAFNGPAEFKTHANIIQLVEKLQPSR